jgi:transposase
MAYKYGNREQLTMFPESISSYISEEDPVRVYDVFIDAINLNTIGINKSENKIGSSAYDPQTMLKILVYAYSYGWKSSRKIERALHHNLSFIWLAGGLKPDHKTLSNFRKKHKKAFKKLLYQCARVCYDLELIVGNCLFVDGSKMRANAGKDQTKSKQGWEDQKTKVEKRIASLMQEIEEVDKENEVSLVKLKKELTSKKRLQEKIGGLLDQMDKEESQKINGTDPEAHLMKGRQGSHPSYNTQLTSDGQHGLIVNLEATQSKNDLNQLKKQVDQSDKILGHVSQTIVADAGYSSIEDIAPLMEEKTIVVPTKEQVVEERRNRNDNPFLKSKFSYNEKKDEYTCPLGKSLKRKEVDKKRNRIKYGMKDAKDCQRCKHFGECTKSKKGRSIWRLQLEKAKDNQKMIYESERGQELFKQRKAKVEHQFGHIKNNLGFKSFLLRGLEGANAELGIYGTCFNIRRLITIFGGVKNFKRQFKAL